MKNVFCSSSYPIFKKKGFFTQNPPLWWRHRHYDDVIQKFSCQQVYFMMVFHRGKVRLSSTFQSKVIGRWHTSQKSPVLIGLNEYRSLHLQMGALQLNGGGGWNSKTNCCFKVIFARCCTDVSPCGYRLPLPFFLFMSYIIYHRYTYEWSNFEIFS